MRFEFRSRSNQRQVDACSGKSGAAYIVFDSINFLGS